MLTTISTRGQSVLRSGDWYKIGVTKAGVYKIDYSFLEEMGLNPVDVDPEKFAIYGNAHAGLLPQRNDIARPILQEYAIYFQGGNDDSFGQNDYFLFYAHGPDAMNYDQESDIYHYEKNFYVDSTANYFITIKNEAGKRIQTQNVPITATEFQTTFKKFQVFEEDVKSLISSGRNWYGPSYSNGTNRQIEFSSLGVLANSEVRIFYNVLSRSESQASFDFALNGAQVGNQLLPRIPPGRYQDVATFGADTIVTNITSSDQLNIGLTFNASDTYNGHLDYVAVQTTNDLNLDHAPIEFNLEWGNQAFEISNEGSKEIWDITDEANPSAIIASANRFQAASGSSKFFAFDPNLAISPFYEGKNENQDLRSIDAVDVLYITHSSLISEAKRLAAHRMSHDGLVVETVTVDQIFNDFSVGQRDVTAIRDFVKYVYDKGGQRLQHVLMFGDGSYAYRLEAARPYNMVPVYSSRNSVHELESYSSDDFFGFLEEHEGEWDESGDGRSGDHTLDIGVGRLPVANIAQARNVVNKIIRYETSQFTFGNWRNKITFVADDGDNNIHQSDAEKLSVFVDTTRNQFNIDKIYLDAFPQESNSSPAAKQAFFDALSNGSLIVNYIGHGNTGLLAREQIFVKSQIAKMTNRLRMPFFVTATCQFGKYDDYSTVTAGEEIVLKGDGGAIGLLTSTRSVFSNSNYALNEAFYRAAMQKENGKFMRLGDIFKNAKNNSLEGFRNRNYSLLADPSMRLAFPDEQVMLRSVNGKPMDQADTLKALSKITLGGEVIVNGQIDPEFNGVVTVTVFDKPSAFRTLNNEGTGVRTYGIQDVLLFQGNATVENGQFTIDFNVPKNISYNYGSGKVSFYAFDEERHMDAHGSTNQLIVGGSVPSTDDDTTPPTISVYLNDTTFLNGGRVKPGPILLAKLFDESGINLSRSSFGYDISYSLDGGESKAINEYYTAEVDDFRSGWVTFPINNIEIGKHELSLTAYDIYNNQASRTIEFYVTDQNEIEITKLINYPNPMRFGGSTTIKFEHDRPGDNLDVIMSIINFRGQEIIRNTYRFDDSSPQSEIEWNGTDASGNRVKPGIYIYRLFVQSELDGSSSILSQKLVVTN